MVVPIIDQPLRDQAAIEEHFRCYGIPEGTEVEKSYIVRPRRKITPVAFMEFLAKYEHDDDSNDDNNNNSNSNDENNSNSNDDNNNNSNDDNNSNSNDGNNSNWD